MKRRCPLPRSVNKSNHTTLSRLVLHTISLRVKAHLSLRNVASDDFSIERSIAYSLYWTAFWPVLECQIFNIGYRARRIHKLIQMYCFVQKDPRPTTQRLRIIFPGLRPLFAEIDCNCQELQLEELGTRSE